MTIGGGGGGGGGGAGTGGGGGAGGGGDGSRTAVPGPSAAPGRVRRLADLAARVRTGPARLGPVRLVTVDGPAGSGKSTFAGRLAAELRAAGSVVEEVSTDDLLDGWVDLDSFWPRLESGVLVPLAAGRPGGYRSYDWGAGRFRRQRTPVAVPDVLIVEGVTSTRAVGPGRTTVAIRIFAPRDLRLSRGIARDGERLRPQWLRWMRAEDDYMAQDPPGADDVLVDGASTFPHDARREYVEAGG